MHKKTVQELSKLERFTEAVTGERKIKELNFPKTRRFRFTIAYADIWST
ncbi:hypothetical protein HMPREF0495_02141 [Levilactobacillus brevis ATCC 14869 = DSM 20054]|uniref:Uncharacterized protein n=1 Tax=Levilactobacillus brevis ATCC 14869 = DSM 20054 TaxID=649758 RepID=U2PDB2_LEVBR|nr:hypothetical protein HMPREF0495_02141 [Levilactobacillus brevis ATCC 14869 = DSM 20054]